MMHTLWGPLRPAWLKQNHCLSGSCGKDRFARACSTFQGVSRQYHAALMLICQTDAGGSYLNPVRADLPAIRASNSAICGGIKNGAGSLRTAIHGSRSHHSASSQSVSCGWSYVSHTL